MNETVMDNPKQLGTSHDEVLFSKVIDYMRFPLIVGVIFIHNYRMADNMEGVESFTSTNLPIYYYVSNLFSNTLASIAVPLFFFISGYLFFYKVNSFSSTTYLYKLKKRFRTLLVPYIFWNLLLYVVISLASLHPKTAPFVSEYDYNIFEAFVGKLNSAGAATYPLVYQLWFIRDLIVCVIISPLIYFVITKLRYFGVILLGLGWFLGYSIPFIGGKVISMVALFFFTFGSWLSYHKNNMIALLKNLKWVALSYPVIMIIDLLTKPEVYNRYIHQFGIVVGIIGCFLLVALLIEKFDLKPVPFLSSASFFIFAVHDPWILWVLRKVMFSVFNPHSDITVTILYFAVVLVVVLVALAVYWILKKLMPSFASIISGGR
ncbi:MAG: acyltransferase [Muribaculaceae bacterium]|nr:acyltransferase [Muribaculaceae bacterium]